MRASGGAGKTKFKFGMHGAGMVVAPNQMQLMEQRAAEAEQKLEDAVHRVQNSETALESMRLRAERAEGQINEASSKATEELARVREECDAAMERAERPKRGEAAAKQELGKLAADVAELQLRLEELAGLDEEQVKARSRIILEKELPPYSQELFYGTLGRGM